MILLAWRSAFGDSTQGEVIGMISNDSFTMDNAGVGPSRVVHRHSFFYCMPVEML